MAADTQRKMIVCADDDAGTRKRVHNALRGLDVDLRLCEDGDDACRMLSDGKPDLVITDLCMPRMDGLTLIRELARRGLHDVPVVVMTVDASDEAMMSSSAAGSACHVVKPFKPKLFSRLVAHLIGCVPLSADAYQSMRLTLMGL